MKIHLKQIPQGGTLHIEGEEDASFVGFEEAGFKPVGPVVYSIDAGLSDDGLFATGSVSVRVKGRCVACLEDFETEVVLDPYATQVELDGRELVDLTGEIREDMHLALPAHPRCDGDGTRTCPARFPQAPATDLPATNTGWDALDKLNIKN